MSRKPKELWATSGPDGTDGVFDTVEDAIDSLKQWMKDFIQDQKDEGSYDGRHKEDDIIIYEPWNWPLREGSKVMTDSWLLVIFGEEWEIHKVNYWSKKAWRTPAHV